MHFMAGEFYHVYNRSNNNQLLFFSEANYLFFIKKIRIQIAPVATIVNYCIMPTHFHLILQANENSVQERESFGGKPMQELPYRIDILLSSYAQFINKQNQSFGSLFQQKSKSRLLSEQIPGKKESYFEECFFYVHNNPKKDGLVNDLKDWPYSSYLDYVGKRNGTLCNKELFFKISGLTGKDILERHKE